MDRSLIVFSYDFPPFDGGIARLCWAIAMGMESHYNEVIVLTTKKNGLTHTYDTKSLKIIELPAKRVFAELKAFYVLKKISNKGSIDIICSQWHPEGFLALVAGFKNVFILAHGTELLAGTSKFRKEFWLPRYAKIVLGAASSVIANSRYTSSLVQKTCSSANVITLPLAVDEKVFRPSLKKAESHTFRLCSVSRIEKFKGHDFIAKVIAQLPEIVKRDIRWEIAGTGPDLQYLKDLVETLAISDIVNFHGFIPDDELADFYRESDVFVLCSRESLDNIFVEGFGLVFLEAQSCGIPVIGTYTGGIPDAIKNEEGGWLIEQDNEMQLQSLLEILFFNRDILMEQSAKARHRILREATWEIYNNRLKKLINERVN